jgi:hypothetical protein
LQGPNNPRRILLDLFDPDVAVIYLEGLGKQKGLSYGITFPKSGVMLPVSFELITFEVVAGSDHYLTTLLIFIVVMFSHPV